MRGHGNRTRRLAAGLLTLWAVDAGAKPSALDAAFEEAARAGFTGQVVAADAEQVRFDRWSGPETRGGLWPWGSVSKQVTAALVMGEVDRKRLSLEDPISRRLPGFPNAATGRVTLEQLLRHNSGLPNPEDSPVKDGVPGFYLRPGADVGGRNDAVGFCAGAPKREPGVSFEYNNCDTVVLGAILEHATGQSFARLVEQRLVKPLGLKSLRLANPGERVVTARSSEGPVPRVNLRTFGPGGALVGTARDLVRFDQALLRHRLVSPASTARMWRGEPSLGYVALGAWSFKAPLKGCEGSVALVERRGAVGGIQVRNLLAPELGRILVVFTDDAEQEFGEIWQGQGLTHALASAAFCG